MGRNFTKNVLEASNHDICLLLGFQTHKPLEPFSGLICFMDCFGRSHGQHLEKGLVTFQINKNSYCYSFANTRTLLIGRFLGPRKTVLIENRPIRGVFMV